jgi:hypothetical protein
LGCEVIPSLTLVFHFPIAIPAQEGMTANMAEGVGFEPTSPVSQAKRLAGARTRPTMRPLPSLVA